VAPTPAIGGAQCGPGDSQEEGRVPDPSVFVVHEFSVRPADQAEVETSIAAIVGHIEAEHPEVLTCDTHRQWVGPRPHRGYVFREGFASLTEMENAPDTPVCIDVWQPIYRLAQEGTVTRGVWVATARELSMRRG
jgi:hypothetical protein